LVIVNKSLYVKLNCTTSVISMLKDEKSTQIIHFQSESIRDRFSGYEKNNRLLNL